MGERGPLPDMSNVAEFPGANKNKKRAPHPQAVPGIPEPARWVPAAGRARWKAVAPELDRLRLLGKTLDRDFSTLYADTYAKWELAAKTINTEGQLAAGQHGETRKHPAMQNYRELSSQLLALEVQAGMTPNSRLRMRAPEVPDDDRRGILS
jgi:P27 family predicted phage terminase small subunit